MKLRRSKLRFSLRTLLLLVTVLLVWLGYYVNWKHQRRQALELPHNFWRRWPPESVEMPFGLLLVGDEPREGIDLPPSTSDEQLAQMQKLFPEAEVRRSLWSPDQNTMPMEAR
jgi:hypothetical protein